jgi:4'-phosphopantetheinyl transferase
VDLDRNPDGLPALEETLASEERRKAEGFRARSDRNRYVVARAALRNILARYLNTCPGELVFRYGAAGKPELEGGAVSFNISHSHDLALCAISSTCEVGVDVERIASGVEHDLAAWLCSGSTFRRLQALPQSARAYTFLQGWTRMEAYSKALGDGLAPSLENFDRFLCRVDERGWWFHDFCPRRGYLATLAAQSRRRRLRYRQWQGPGVSDRFRTADRMTAEVNS